MLIDLRRLSTIKPFPGNPRVNEGAIKPVASSIKTFGFNQPLVLDRFGVIVVGHTRYFAALELGLEEVPVYVADHLSEAEAKAYRIADNQTATYSRFDEAKLLNEIIELQKLDYPIVNTGLTLGEIDQLLANQQHDLNGDPDSIPEPPDKAVTQLGDLYQLGNHRLLCGDAADWATVERLINGQPVAMVHTDPPYNVRVEPRSNNAIAAGNSSFKATARKRSHHQAMDLAQDPGKARPTHQKLRAKDRPLINDFLSDDAFANMLDTWFGNLARRFGLEEPTISGVATLMLQTILPP
ncbi:MAG: ParB N-terminal domain-containing protein [Gemmatales bacterium]